MKKTIRKELNRKNCVEVRSYFTEEDYAKIAIGAEMERRSVPNYVMFGSLVHASRLCNDAKQLELQDSQVEQEGAQ